MNGIEKITGRISADAQQEIDQISAAAEAEAREITARYEAQSKREYDEILARGKVRAQEREERLASVARLEAKKLVLAAKQEMLDKAFEYAHNELLELPEQDYVKLLSGLAAAASRSGREQVILSQKDRTRFGKQVVTAANEKLGPNASLTLSEESRPVKGGLILSDGKVEVNCTFETLIRLQKGKIAGEVAKILFEH